MRAALRQLGLSADQKTRIAGMLASFRASRQTSTPMTRKQLMSDIAGVLTPDQRTKLHAIMRRRRPGTAESAPAAT
jgi:Spy/CpxP family protein refolding chaperone